MHTVIHLANKIQPVYALHVIVDNGQCRQNMIVVSQRQHMIVVNQRQHMIVDISVQTTHDCSQPSTDNT